MAYEAILRYGKSPTRPASRQNGVPGNNTCWSRLLASSPPVASPFGRNEMVADSIWGIMQLICFEIEDLILNAEVSQSLWFKSHHGHKTRTQSSLTPPESDRRRRLANTLLDSSVCQIIWLISIPRLKLSSITGIKDSIVITPSLHCLVYHRFFV